MTPHKSLRSLFENNININHIAELIKTFNVDDDISKANRFMEENDYDCVGVEENGRVVGYIVKGELNKGRCGDCKKSFVPGEIVSDTTSLIQVLYLFKDKSRLFILEGNKITKLVTHSDLQKQPVQLLLFGFISLLEMHLVDLIKIYLPNDSWKKYLSEGRIEKANNIFRVC